MSQMETAVVSDESTERTGGEERSRVGNIAQGMAIPHPSLLPGHWDLCMILPSNMIASQIHQHSTELLQFRPNQIKCQTKQSSNSHEIRLDPRNHSALSL